ncbi:LysM peptidoglycan-binding domain-containing protein [Cohnella suwonensis]|uniref:LysM peptidoglycan-binding domain-containing protein n=1 Tax=Cohnella suwonensis TaxID=696072 RepID=A0ABW0LSR5_9BACL
MVHTWVSTAPATSSHHKSSTYVYTSSSRRKASSFNWRIARGFFFLIAFLLLFSGFTLVRVFASSGESVPVQAHEVVVSIDSGDSLWGIANANKKDGMDTRKAVHEIQKRNALTSSQVDVGQQLILPESILP